MAPNCLKRLKSKMLTYTPWATIITQKLVKESFKSKTKINLLISYLRPNFVDLKDFYISSEKGKIYDSHLRIS